MLLCVLDWKYPFSVLLAFTNKFNSFIPFLRVDASICIYPSNGGTVIAAIAGLQLLHKAVENLIKVQIVCGMYTDIASLHQIHFSNLIG